MISHPASNLGYQTAANFQLHNELSAIRCAAGFNLVAYHGRFNADTIWIVGCDGVQFHWSKLTRKNNPTELDFRRSEQLYKVLIV